MNVIPRAHARATMKSGGADLSVLSDLTPPQQPLLVSELAKQQHSRSLKHASVSEWRSESLFSSLSWTKVCLLVCCVMAGLTVYKSLNTKTAEELLQKVQDDPYGKVHYFVLFYIISVPLCFPCMIMQVISGAMYGFFVGFIISWLATSLGQSLAFVLGRHLFRKSVKQYLQKHVPSFAPIDMAIRKEGWKLVCLLRLSPILPYNVLNYAAALTPVSFTSFSLASALAIIPWTFVYVYIGTFSTSVLELARGKVNFTLASGGQFHFLSTVGSLVLMGITTVYGYIVSKRAITAVLKDAAQANKDQEPASSDVEGGNSSEYSIK